MFDRIVRRERWFGRDDTLRASIRFLIKHHLRASQYDGSWTDSAVRRFAREIGAHLDDLLCLSRADITTKRPQKRAAGIALIDGLASRITHLAEEDARVPPLPTGVGNDVMAAFDLRPSRLIGDIKRELEAAVEAGEIEPHRDAEYYVRFIDENRSRFGL
jgi:poly(A) polymerase